MPDIKKSPQRRSAEEAEQIMDSNQPIGVFDSGMGGLSVLRELERLLPNEKFIFLADQKYVPYGEKSKKQLINLAYRIVDFFINKYDVKMIVIACNTSTCYSIDALRKKYSLPIVGTVPAVKKAGENTKSGAIAIISTPATSKSPTLKKLIKDNCNGIQVFNIGCKDLENAVEEGEIDAERVHILLQKYLGKIKNSKVDHLVLGCTHYPFLKKTIKKYVNSKVKLVDGGLAIAKRVRSLLKTYFFKNSKKTKGEIIYFTTGDSARFSKVASKLLKQKIQAKRVQI